MASLNLISNGPGAGKTCLAGALAVRHSELGKRVAYYKPLSLSPDSDPDVGFLANLLEGLGSPQEGAPPPLTLSNLPDQAPASLDDERAAEIEAAISGLEARFDLVLVDWAAPVAPAGRPLVLVYGCSGDEPAGATVNAVTEMADGLGDDLARVVLNHVPRHRRREISDQAIALLKERGLPMMGAIPEDREMLALTLKQVADFLDGQWVREPTDGQVWVDRFLIGGNILDSGPNYLGRYPNQAVITRAARPDIQMASLMCGTKLLILTGGEDPTEYIRVEAQKKDASLLLVPGNTLDTAESLGGLVDLANPYSRHKLARFGELADRHLEGGLEGLLP